MRVMPVGMQASQTKQHAGGALMVQLVLLHATRDWLGQARYLITAVAWNSLALKVLSKLSYGERLRSTAN